MDNCPDPLRFIGLGAGRAGYDMYAAASVQFKCAVSARLSIPMERRRWEHYKQTG